MFTDNLINLVYLLQAGVVLGICI